jgi:hypothetical protein
VPHREPIKLIQIKVQNTIINLELKELSKVENFDKITSLVCKSNNLTDLNKILEYKDKNRNFLSLEYSNSAVNKKLLSLYSKYRHTSETVLGINESKTTVNNKKDIIQFLPDYTIDDLTETENLGLRSYNICKYYNLLTLKDLVTYYFDNGDFLNMRNCGLKSNEELIDVCEKYSKFKLGESADLNDRINDNHDIPSELSFSNFVIEEELSVRAQHICEDNDLNSPGSILEYLRKHGDFLKLRNCGLKSNEELLEVCKKFEKGFNQKQRTLPDDKTENTVIHKIEKLSPTQKQIVNNFINKQFSELPPQYSNVLYYFLSADISLKGLITIFEEDNFKMINLRNAGPQTIHIFHQFLDKIEAYIDLTLQLEGDYQPGIVLLHSVLKNKFTLLPSVLSEIGNGYDFSRGLPLFKTLKVLLENDILFNKREKEIIKNSFRYFRNIQSKSIAELAVEHNISNDTVRQIRKRSFHQMNNYFLFVKQLDFNKCNLYNIDIQADVVTFEEDLIAEMNKQEDNSFNKLFVNKILSILLSDTIELIGNEEKIVLGQSANSSHNWKSTYLIKKELTDGFDFNKLVKAINYRLSQKITKDYNIHFVTLLKDFRKNCKEELSERITSVAEKLLLAEFELKPDNLKNLCFSSNKKRPVTEYVIDILKAKNKPMTVYEILDILNKTAPGLAKNAVALRWYCRRDERFIFFGRSSIYGLKEWEKKMNIRGGTIREIVEEYLINKSGPRHISEITEYVNKYRNTHERNVYLNLKLDKSGRFIIYPENFIGLMSSVKNQIDEVKSAQVKHHSWDEKFELLKEFTQKNNRLPSASGNDPEPRHYFFMNLQLRKAKEGKLDKAKVMLINELVNNYDFKQRKSTKINKDELLYNELEIFITEHKRIPKANHENEKRLFNFLYHQSIDYNNGDLTDEQLNKYLKIKNLLKAVI